MRYSLSSRFRGTLLGAALGENFASHVNKQSPQVDGWDKMAVVGAESLIHLGRFDLDDWRALFCRESSNQDAMHRASTKAIIATLPIVLFYHDNEIKLRQNVQQMVAVWHDDPVIRDGALSLGYAIAKCLTEKLNPFDLIPQTIAFLGETQYQMAQQLAKVQTLLEQSAGLERAVTQLGQLAQPSTPIALAFYCFLSTLEDLPLSVRRAARTGYQPEITSAITGALSGAYNSTAGIPISWRMALSRPDAKLAAWGMTTEAEMLKLSDSLVAVWSGVYDQVTHPTELTPVAAIAAPRVMRLR